MLNENPSVILKRKNIQAVLDYCLDNKIDIRVTARTMPEEYEIEFSVSDIMRAINLGMFLKENKLELITGGVMTRPVQNTITSAVKTSAKPRKTASKETKTVQPPNDGFMLDENPVVVSQPETQAENLHFEAPKDNKTDDIFASGEENSVFGDDDLFMQN